MNLWIDSLTQWCRGSFISLHREGHRTPPSPNFPELFTPTESHWLKGRLSTTKPFLSPQLSRVKSGMRDCLPAVLFRSITFVMDDLKVADGCGDYPRKKLRMKKQKCCLWLAVLREHSSACCPCLCQAAHTTFYIQVIFFPPPPRRLVKRRHPPAGSCCFLQLSEDKTDQQREPDVWLPAKTMMCVGGTVIPNVRCSLARQGSVPISYEPRSCFPVRAATSTG